MEDLANKVFDQISDRDGFQLAQVRFVDHQEEILQYRNGLPFNSSRQKASGVGIGSELITHGALQPQMTCPQQG